MGTKVEAKTHFPGSMMDLNNTLCNNMWDPYHNDRTSGSKKGQFYDSILVRQAMDGYPGYAKEQMRQTILKQESIFRHQLQELHRLYKRQRDLMNELAVKQHYNIPIPADSSKSTHFLSQFPSRVSKDPHVDSIFGRVSISETNNPFSHPNHLKGKTTLNEFRPLNSKCSITEKRVIDLELPADLDEDNEGNQQVENVCNLNTKRAYNLADLNEPIHVEETSFSASRCVTEKLQKQDLSSNSNSGFWYLSKISQQNLKEMEQPSYSFADGKTKSYDNGLLSFPITDQNKAECQRKRTIFGVELCERNHTPSFDSSSFDASRQIPELFAGNKRFNNSTLPCQNGVGFLSGINFKNSVSDSLEGPCPTKKQNFIDMEVQNRHNTEKRLPPWLTTNSNSSNEQTKGKETTLYQMNLDSLQNHSQQFFKKTETTKGIEGITKILGVPIIDVPENSKDLVNQARDLRHHIDLNLSFDEEEAKPPLTPCIPESVVKIATKEIDLEAPTVLESETNPPEINIDIHEELVKVAAEAIMSISVQPPEEAPPSPPPPPATLLQWFADVIALRDSANVSNNENSIPEGMDYFEYMTLNLQETKEEYIYDKLMIMEEKEDDDGLSRKRTTRKGQKRGRQRKDFQRDVLPGIVSLSRREVTEDLQTFEEAFTGIGVSWHSSLSKRKAAAKNGRGRRRLVVPDTSSPPPMPQPEQIICQEVALEEKSLSGWGKRTRRLPRQRCQNGGNHHSLALKC